MHGDDLNDLVAVHTVWTGTISLVIPWHQPFPWCSALGEEGWFGVSSPAAGSLLPPPPQALLLTLAEGHYLYAPEGVCRLKAHSLEGRKSGHVEPLSWKA